MKKVTYIIRDKEAGNVIDSFDSLAAAEQRLAEYEEEDKRDGSYTPDFYEIVEQEEENDNAIDREV